MDSNEIVQAHVLLDMFTKLDANTLPEETISLKVVWNACFEKYNNLLGRLLAGNGSSESFQAIGLSFSRHGKKREVKKSMNYCKPTSNLYEKWLAKLNKSTGSVTTKDSNEETTFDLSHTNIVSKVDESTFSHPNIDQVSVCTQVNLSEIKIGLKDLSFKNKERKYKQHISRLKKAKQNLQRY